MAQFVETTIAVLSSLLPSGKPKLTPELLSRPPFRFLHDVVTEIHRATGFGTGLFTAAEQDARAMDKDAKLGYLQKLVDVIAVTLGQPVPARPSKIVAGLEPEATNTMLQMLAAAVHRSDSSAAAVQAVLRQRAASATHPRGAATSSSGGGAGLKSVTQSGAAARTLTLEESQGDASREVHVVFARLDNLLPVLSRRTEEARLALSSSTLEGSQIVLGQCNQVQAIAEDAVVLAKCLEGLQGSMHKVAAEVHAWTKEADRLAARVQQEERAEQEAAAAAQQRLAQLEADMRGVQQRLVAWGRG